MGTLKLNLLFAERGSNQAQSPGLPIPFDEKAKSRQVFCAERQSEEYCRAALER
jgi:hypothetical protein